MHLEYIIFKKSETNIKKPIDFDRNIQLLLLNDCFNN